MGIRGKRDEEEYQTGRGTAAIAFGHSTLKDAAQHRCNTSITLCYMKKSDVTLICNAGNIQEKDFGQNGVTL